MRPSPRLRLAAVLALALILAPQPSRAQTPGQGLAVQLRATAQPAAIRLDWTPMPSATAHGVYRKDPTANAWGAPLATLGATDSTWTDSTAAPGTVYEYRVVRSGTPVGNGYVQAAIQRPAVHERGVLILVVDSTHLADTAFAALLGQTQEAISADGWHVRRILVQPSWAPPRVKDSIAAHYAADPANTRALYLLGHVPVPYSGLINPDGHPEHFGAWPTDLYYADIAGPAWTDAFVNDVSSTTPRNHNVPADGKFDHSALPSDAELMTGRVDFHDLPAFAASETELLKRYLRKSLAFKHAQFRPADRALLDDNFTGMAEGFSASGYRSYGPLICPDSLHDGTDFFAGSSATGGQPYLFGYGCGPGWYTSCAGVGTTQDFAADSLQVVHSMLFGSYFGDWDSTDNFLRAALAQGNTLSSAWAGRPHWVFHPMGIGEPIGQCALLTQNNSTTYHVSTLPYFARWIHITLMGDPTLRMHYLAPPSNLSAVYIGTTVLTWTPSPDPVVGYHVYRQHADSSAFVRLTDQPVAAPTFSDATAQLPGVYTYRVRAVEWDTTCAGSYANLSLGVDLQVTLLLGQETPPSPRLIAWPNPSSGILHLAGPTAAGEVQLRDLTGRLLIRQPYQPGMALDIRHLPAGTYLVEHAAHAGGRMGVRVLKQ